MFAKGRNCVATNLSRRFMLVINNMFTALDLHESEIDHLVSS